MPTTGVANSRGNEVLRAADDRALFDSVINDRPLPGQPGATPPPAPAPLVPAEQVALRLVDARSDSGDAAAAAASTGSSVEGGTGDDSSDGGSSDDASGFRRDRTAQGPSETSVAGALRGYGFTVSGGGTRGPPSDSHTAIRFSPDQAGAAATLQRAVPGAVLAPQAGGSGQLVLQLGDDFDGRVLNPTAPPPAAPAPALVNAADSVCG